MKEYLTSNNVPNIKKQINKDQLQILSLIISHMLEAACFKFIALTN